MEIYDLTKCEYSNRHGSYGGMDGDKDGIIFNNEFWIVKYPKSSKQFITNLSVSYVSSPLSEFIGSNIYEILGYDVHKTILGYRNNKIVVACKDFRKKNEDLREMNKIKNAANRELAEIYQNVSFTSSSTGDRVQLQELLLHLKNNTILSKVSGVTQRFWETAVIDILIDNNDRNNGNWGILYNSDTDKYRLAPIYDNGNSFSNKASEEDLEKYLQEKDLENRLIGGRTAYDYNGKTLSAKKLLNFDNNDLKEALIKIIPIIEQKLPIIFSFIDDIPEKYNDSLVCSKSRKEYYKLGIQKRFDKLLFPAYKR